MPEEPEQAKPECTVSTQTDEACRLNLSASFQEVSAQVKHLQSSCEVLKSKCARLEGDNSCHVRERKVIEERLKETMLDEDSFRDNDVKVLFYTGLTNWNILFIVFSFVQSHIAAAGHTSLSPFQQLLLTLMRLRLSLSVQDLGYRFAIHKSTVSRIFSSVLDVLFVRLKYLIIWPSQDVLIKTLPMDFRKHCPKCVVIIDCFEIFIDRPTDLLARAQTYSSYKHHNTVKYLIGITPQGSVSFISEGWGGRVSDKHLTQNSGLLDHLLPGNTVLADRGFDIKESVGLYCATLVMPAFTKGKKQLSGIEVEQTRNIANVRIHVERVIGNLRQKYSFLSSTQPIDHLICKPGESSTTLDKIVTVCCSLTNLCNSVVPLD